jgi:putative Holliday junction resolvase
LLRLRLYNLLVAARVLGIDYGSRRIGLAVGDLQTRLATPLETLGGRNDPTRDARAVADLAVREEISRFVVGLPLNLDSGTDSEQTRITRKFAEELARLTGKPVHLQDERLSSFAAQEALNEGQVPARSRKGLSDRIAAQKILQAWLDGPPAR